MKKLTFTFALALVGFLGYSQQASQLIPTQGNNPKPTTPPNYLYVDVSTNRIWPVLADSIRLKSINIQWLNDSVIVIGDRRWVKLSGTYPNPSFIASLSSSKVTGLSTVATSGDYNDLSNKPNLSMYETTSHANSTFYPLTNPNGFISSYTETDPVWSGVSTNYRTKVQNDGLYYPLTGNPSNFLTAFVEVDPTVPSYSKSLTAFSVIKSSTDPLYRPITYTPSSADIVSGLGYTPVTNARTLTINGTAFDLSANRSWTVGDVTSASLSSTLSSYVLTSTYTAGLAAKQNTLVSGTNIKTVGGQTLLGAGDIALNTGTVTSVGISSTDLTVSGSPITSSGNITANLTTTGVTAGTYGRVTVDTKGRVTAGKRQETYSGTTDASGNYTVTFSTPYSVAPNIQQNLIGGNALQGTLITSITATGFTIQAYTRSTVSSLPIVGVLAATLVGTATNPLIGGGVDVLITEK